MLLALSTWPEIEAFLARSKTVVIPIGSNEQHGPTGLLGTDWLCPEIIAHRAAQSEHGAGELLVAPTFAVGMAQHHLGFPGSISLRPSTMIAAIRDWAVSLHGPWLRGVVFSKRPRWQCRDDRGGLLRNLRRGQLSPSAAGLRHEAAQLVGPSGRDAPLLRPVPRGPWQPRHPVGDRHHPVPPIRAPSSPPTTRPASRRPDRSGRRPISRARYPDGRMGSDPGPATPEKGAEIVELAVKGLIEEVRAFGRETAPG